VVFVSESERALLNRFGRELLLDIPIFPRDP